MPELKAPNKESEEYARAVLLAAPNYDPKEQDRITCQFSIVHEHCGDPPFTLGCSFSSICKTVEQPWTRRVQIGEQWIPLDIGWIENPGLIVIENQTGKGLLVNPTEEELAEINSKMIYVTCNEPDVEWIIMPRMHFFARPKTLENIRVRSSSGKIKASIHVLPE